MKAGNNMKKLISIQIIIIIIAVFFPYFSNVIEYAFTNKLEITDLLVVSIPIFWLFIWLIISSFIWIKPVRDKMIKFMDTIESITKKYSKINLTIIVIIFSFILKLLMEILRINFKYAIDISLLFVLVLIALLSMVKLRWNR